MYPQYWTPSIGGTYQNRKAEAAAQKYGAAASAFYLLRPLRVPTVPFHLILPPQKVVFARRICARRAARLSREWPFVLPKSRTLPGKKHRKTASAIYSAVSYRFYNVFCKKSFTNEFQKHII
ncbi:hypothetical protein [Faecalibacterium prausnitzii]|uniref:Uncharacterized protein n=1 Tax=Faecalibacterium prausnitzii M21/2 TaxID=411485 RepID=A8SGW9_9FIRM|nr:hypothetical protein [Faecalibacterium prausnitzii]EDP20391.1 hypothetical protein FAEPRAM212_03186 [Faecalibacterium prausnitzii M21/2]MEE0187963.1 hypothetical protein [Faecalibacterium prausnitzii]